MALELKFVNGRGYQIYNTKEVEKEHKEEAKAHEEVQEEQEVPVLLVIHVNNFLHSSFSNVEKYINNQQLLNCNGLYAHKSYFSK